MWWEVIRIGRRYRDMASGAGLRFSPLEIFAKCQFQPVRSRIFRVRTGLSLASIAVVVHREPVRMRGCSDVIALREYTGELPEFEAMIGPIEALAVLGVPWK
jgi:hypothetical protein